MDYLELRVTLTPFQPWAEIVTAQLATIGFDSFVEEKNVLLAYAPKESWSEKELRQTLSALQTGEVQLSWETNEIENQNWNAAWESEFQPVFVADRLVICAPFHEIKDDFEYAVVIQPQMSFGTGHHQTTWLLSKRMLAMDFKNKSVLDVGTGTGVLAILANLLGATSIVATEIDAGSCENALENFERNNCSTIQLIEGDIDKVDDNKRDVIIANINKNILKKHLPHYSERIKKGGRLLLSGFFDSDVEELEKSAESCNFKKTDVFTKEEWAVLELIKV